MNNRDYDFLISLLGKRVTALEEKVTEFEGAKINPENDWDNSTLIRAWGISPRTAANYRSNGLGFFKIGGRLYYSPEQREDFITKNKKGGYNG